MANVKKTTAESLKATMYVQYQAKEVTVEDIVEKAKEAYKAEGHRVSSIKSLKVYIKPEESAAYYVINENNAGKIEL